jgi:hypothetical protein
MPGCMLHSLTSKHSIQRALVTRKETNSYQKQTLTVGDYWRPHLKETLASTKLENNGND